MSNNLWLNLNSSCTKYQLTIKGTEFKVRSRGVTRNEKCFFFHLLLRCNWKLSQSLFTRSVNHCDNVKCFDAIYSN